MESVSLEIAMNRFRFETRSCEQGVHLEGGCAVHSQRIAIRAGADHSGLIDRLLSADGRDGASGWLMGPCVGNADVLTGDRMGGFTGRGERCERV